MKLKIPGLLFVSLILSTAVFSQSVVIKSKKTTFTRPKPLAEFKKTFTINYPKVSGVRSALARKIERSISYAEVMQFDPKDELGEYQWLEEADFSIVYNKKGVLSVYLSMIGTGAYPQQNGRYVNVDLQTGRRLQVSDIFVNQNGLIKIIKEIQKKEIADSIKEIKEQKDFNEDNPERLFETTDFKAVHLKEFSIGDEGVTFYYDYGFPHIIEALEPTGAYFLGWKQIKPFIRRDGLLAKFVR